MTAKLTRFSILIPAALIASLAGAGITQINMNSPLLAAGEEKDDAQAGIDWRLQAHTRPVSAIAVSPDGRILATGDLDGKVTLWDVTGKMPAEKSVLYKAQRFISGIQFSSDGRYIAVLPAASRVVRLWRVDADGYKEVTMPTLHGDRIWSVAFSPDSESIATAGTQDLTVRIWKLSAMSEHHTPLRSHKDSVEYVCYSPDGKQIASSGEDGMIYIWRLAADGGQSPLAIAVENELGAVRSLQFSADGRNIISGTPMSHKALRSSAEDLQLLCWNATSGKIAKSIIYRGGDSKLNAWAISSDMNRIVLADDLGHVSLYGHDPSEILAQWESGVSIRQIALAADGQSVVTGNQDGTICLIRLPHQK